MCPAKKYHVVYHIICHQMPERASARRRSRRSRAAARDCSALPYIYGITPPAYKFNITFAFLIY